MTEPFNIDIELEQGQSVPVTITPKNPYGESMPPISMSLNYSDKNLQAIQKAIGQFEGNKDDLPLDEQKKAVQSFIDAAFGKGTFDKLYKVTESTEKITVALVKIIALFSKEMKKNNDEKAIQKYLEDNA
ncbi:MAG: hypothetical protein ABF913_04755 [Oenococcus sp.]|uniref:hypothetical protein n=1 Tax=Oenococcus sp. TaxID=1979414 RepID=UPI0039EA98EE